MNLKPKKYLFIIIFLFSIFLNFSTSILAHSHFIANNNNQEEEIIESCSTNRTQEDEETKSRILSFAESWTRCNGTPEASNSGGSRGGSCPKKDIPLIPLVGHKSLEVTGSDRPIFWVYMPYTSAEAATGTLQIEDTEKSSSIIHRGEFPLPAKPGIIGIQPSTLSSPLSKGKKYVWYVQIKCVNSDQFSTPNFFKAHIHRSIHEDVSSPNSIAKIKRYVENGMWFDTLTVLAELQLADPNNQEAVEAWTYLLEQVLIPAFLKKEWVWAEKIAQEPLIGIFTTNSQQ